MPPAVIMSGSRPGFRFGGTDVEVGAPHVSGLGRVEEDGHPAVGHLGGHLDVLGAERGHPDRDAGPDGVGDDLERFAQAGAFPFG
jgi:hypothetical protein